MKKRAIVVCPGRGTYNREELGYLQRFHAEKTQFIESMDDYRTKQNQSKISELDSADRYKLSLHTRGDNASALIYTCALADFACIDTEKFDIVAITGNSMGWYLALAAAGACSLENGMHIVNTMGTMMHNEAEGGQLIYPLCDENWLPSSKLKNQFRETLDAVKTDDKVQVFESIRLGSLAVVAANKIGIDTLVKQLPRVQEKYPLVLPNHGAFHSPLMKNISDKALTQLGLNLFNQPNTALVDGRGMIWQSNTCDLDALHDYTFKHQVCECYDYSMAIEVACKEFAPDCLIILGPGASLGAPTAQQLIQMAWRDIKDKHSFKKLQQTSPFIYSMGIEEQRTAVCKN